MMMITATAARATQLVKYDLPPPGRVHKMTKQSFIQGLDLKQHLVTTNCNLDQWRVHKTKFHLTMNCKTKNSRGKLLFNKSHKITESRNMKKEKEKRQLSSSHQNSCLAHDARSQQNQDGNNFLRQTNQPPTHQPKNQHKPRERTQNHSRNRNNQGTD